MGPLTILLLIPLLALLVGLALPSGRKDVFRYLALGTALAQAVVFFTAVPK